jgi:hypothetical protein
LLTVGAFTLLEYIVFNSSFINNFKTGALMNPIKLLLFFSSLSTFSAIAGEVHTQTVSDAASMIQRADGKYDVVCKNGTREIATAEQIQKNDVCVRPVVSNIEAVFNRPQGDFFVLCKNYSWETGTADNILCPIHSNTNTRI